jgi:hypothetical protein
MPDTEFEDMFPDREIIDADDLNKHIVSYWSDYLSVNEELGVGTSTIQKELTIDKETYKQEFLKMEQQKIKELVHDILTNLYLDSSNDAQNVIIKRLKLYYYKHKVLPTLTQYQEIVYTVTDLDLKNKRCFHMLVAIDTIEKLFDGNSKNYICKDKKISEVRNQIKEDFHKAFDALHINESIIELYLFELTISLDNETQAGLYKYTSFRCWWVLANKKELSKIYKKRSNENEKKQKKETQKILKDKENKNE